MKNSMLSILAIIYGLNSNAVPAKDRVNSEFLEFGRENMNLRWNGGLAKGEEGLAAVLAYDKGKVVLATDELSMLAEFIDRTVSYADIEAVYVAVWSDKFFHVNATSILTWEDSKLAADRIGALEKFFKTKYDWLDVIYFNMGKGASIFSKLVGTKEARLKAITSGIKLNRSVREFQLIADLSDASTAVVVAKLTNNAFREYSNQYP